MEELTMLATINNRAFLPAFINDFFTDNSFSNLIESSNHHTLPSVNIIEENDDFRIEVAAPGINKDEFKVDFDNDLLTISSEKKEDKENDDATYLRREFQYSQFKRSFSLPDIADENNIKASHKDGVLTVVVPKKEEAKVKPPKSIKIS